MLKQEKGGGRKAREMFQKEFTRWKKGNINKHNDIIEAKYDKKMGRLHRLYVQEARNADLLTLRSRTIDGEEYEIPDEVKESVLKRMGKRYTDTEIADENEELRKKWELYEKRKGGLEHRR